ncbi:nucleobase:cation symporter-2 family protein [Microbacterium murale]|uniref:Xanthine permease n=1 Tax=Microbacterium murale TaxID=1081040 RepID=A0ABU0PCB3_9MICO|nr:nucleobase:cation symporter-2 family protein [Microbacterium murale]MDQ0644963.1 xanthine permease [Microbacterium murale]
MRKTRSTKAASGRQVDEVDELPPVARMIPFALQHVLICYGGLITTPLVVGLALGLTNAEIAALVAANLTVAGFATILQTVGIWKVGVRYPLLMGASFTSIGPAIMIGEAYGLPALYGATMIAGVVTVIVAPFFAKLLRFFPPVVTGTVIAIIGISLMPKSAGLITGQADDPDFASPIGYVLAIIAIALVLIIDRMGRGLWKQLSILIALVIGTVIAAFLGRVDFSSAAEVPLMQVPQPLMFGPPEFILGAIIPILIVQFVCLVESTGDVLAIGQIVGRKTGPKQVSRALLADGFGTALGALLSPFSLTAFANNVGLAQVTRVYSRWVVALAGVFLILFGFIAPLGQIAAGLPKPVLGGITVVMFGTIAAVGVRMLATADLGSYPQHVHRRNRIRVRHDPGWRPDVLRRLP